MPSTVRLVEVRTTGEIVDVLDAADPATFRILGDLEERGIGNEVRGWRAEDADGRPAGALTVARLCRGRWYASVMVFDERAAPAFAEVIAASPAWEVSGAPQHVEPLVPHLTRIHSAGTTPWSIVPNLRVEPPPGLLSDRDPRCRLATTADLDALVRLYANYELEPIPTRRRLRTYLERTLAYRPVIVAEADDQVVGAYRVEFMSSAYVFWSGLTVLPAFRRHHLGSGLSREAIDVTRDLDRGMVLTMAPTNPMQLRPQTEARSRLQGIAVEHGYRRDTWMKVRLGPPNRFPGHHYLRRASEIAEGSVRRREKGPDLRPAP